MSGPGRSRTAITAGAVFVLLGVLFLLDELDVIRLRAVYILPIVLIATGVVILIGALASGGRSAER
jgi:hypothetical protein